MPDGRPLVRLVRRLTSLWGGAYAVLERDFLVTTSTKRFLAVRLAVALVAVIVVAVTAVSNHGAPPDQIGRAVFGAAVIVVPLLILLVSPAMAAPAISTERDGGTLDLVLAAPVGAGTFVLSKFLSRFLNTSVLVFAMLPVASVGFLFGGVAVDTFLAFATFALTTAAFCVAAGIAFSAYLRSPAAAVLGAFLFVLLAPPVPLLLLALIDNSGFDVDRDLAEVFLPFQTFFAWSRLGRSAFRGQAAPAEVWHHAAAMAGVAATLLAVAWRRMRREGRVAARAGRLRAARGLFLGAPLLDRGVRGTILWHPTKRSFVIPGLAVIGDLLLLWGAYAENDLDKPWVHVSALGSLTVLAMLRTLSATSVAISTERRRGSFDVLMAAPFRPAQIAWGGLVSNLVATSPLFALGLLHGTVAAVLGGLDPLVVPAWALTSAILLAFVGALGLRASVTATSPTRSALLGFGVLFGGMGLTILFVFMMVTLNFQEEELLALILSMPPVLAYYVPWSVEELPGRHVSRPWEWWTLLPHASLALYCLSTWLLMASSARILHLRRG